MLCVHVKAHLNPQVLVFNLMPMLWFEQLETPSVWELKPSYDLEVMSWAIALM